MKKRSRFDYSRKSIMVKQSPSRNYRSKGVKVKHVLQICVLLAICFWLIYQVKHSHDKKTTFNEDDARMSGKTQISEEVFNFGRKDLQPRLREETLKNEKVDEEEETVAEEGNKNEEEEQEEDTKNEEGEDEAKVGDDGGDEVDEEKSETEVELEDFFVDGEKEREESDEKEAEEIDLENMERGHKGNMSSLQEHKHDGDSSSRNSHEAREENYRADDASSAVTHETEPETGTVSSNENTDSKVVEAASDKSNTTSGIKSEKGEMGENGISTNVKVKVKEDRGSETSSDNKLEGTSLLNPTVTADSSNQLEVSNNSTDGSLKANTLLLQNGTEIKPDVDEAQNASIALVKENDSDTASNNDQSNPNPVIPGNTGNSDAAVGGELSNPSMGTASETVFSEKVVTSNSSVEVVGQSGLSTTEENPNATRKENLEASDATNKSQDSSESGNADAVQDPIDSTDSSVTLDKKDVQSGGTLPEIRAEGTKNGDAAQ